MYQTIEIILFSHKNQPTCKCNKCLSHREYRYITKHVRFPFYQSDRNKNRTSCCLS
ncbi:hypothetical protein BDB01DRAFT_826380 [Pilobolus umbonatus]|nr:hypothetical protein BDB01DRAFT_826380 [Pilobolus umbonatus]